MEWRHVADVVDAARRLEYRWSLLNVRTAVGGTAAAAVKILIRRIGERGSNYSANYHFKQWIALESSSDVYRETFRDSTTKEPTNRPTHNHQLQVLGEAMGRNKRQRGRWEHRIEARRDTAVLRGGELEERRRAPTECDMGTPYIRLVFEGERRAHPPGGARVGHSIQQSKPYQEIKLIMKTR